MSREQFNLGPCPASEDGAQCGAEGYGLRAVAEIEAYRKQVTRAAARFTGGVPKGVRFARKSFSHDFGSYYELVAYYDDTDHEANKFIWWLDEVLPQEWDDEARAELGLVLA